MYGRSFLCNRSYLQNVLEIKKNQLSSYCLHNVKHFDYENYLVSLLLPYNSRNAAFAIRAFNVELAKVVDSTSEELMARMRYQFWRETVDNIFKDKPPDNPVAKSLHEVKLRHNISKKWLKNLIDSREKRLSKKSFSTLEELEAYAEESNASLYYLILQCLGVADVKADHAVSHIGKSEGIVKLIRSVPYFGSRRTVLLPKSLLASHKVSEEDVIRGTQTQPMKDVVYDIASSAFHHKEQARKLEKDCPRNASLLFLHSVAIDDYLTRLQRCDFDVFHPTLQRRNGLLPIKLFKSKMWKKIRFV